MRTVQIAARHGVSITARGGGTSQAGQAIGAGLQLDTSKYLNRVLEVNVAERWALDRAGRRARRAERAAASRTACASRPTSRPPAARRVGGMIANNSSGARSVLYGKTIDHVLELHVVLVGRIDRAFPAARRRRQLDAACAGDDARSRLLPRRCARSRPRAATRSIAASRRCCAASAATTSTSSSIPAKPFNLVEDHRRLGRHARSRRRGEDQPGAAAGREGGADDRVRRAARRARRDAARAAPPTVGGRGDGSLHPRPREGEPGARRAAAQHPARRSRRAAVRRVLRRSRRGSAAAARRARARPRRLGLSAAAGAAPSPPRIRRASGASAKRRSDCRWR